MKPTISNLQSPIINSGTPVPEFIHEGIPLRLCRNAKPRRGHAQLYCSRYGRFFTVTRRSVNEVKPNYTPERPAKKTGGCAQYMTMRNYGGKACHLLIYEAWIGERTPGMQIDHINGIPTDNRADNLQEVTPAENIKRAKLLRLLRKFNQPYYDEIKYNRRKLLDFFAQYDIAPGASSHRNGMEDCLDLAIRTAGAAGSVAPTRHGLRLEGDSTYDPIEAELSTPTAYHLAEFPLC